MGPSYNISAVLLSIVSFLDDPDCNANPLIEYQYKYDRKTFDKIARERTQNMQHHRMNITQFFIRWKYFIKKSY